MKTITVLVVPVKGAIVTREIPNTLAAMQAIVGGLIERVTLSSRTRAISTLSTGEQKALRETRTTLLYVNEDGIGLGLPVNKRLSEAFGWPLLEQPLHGDGFLTVVSGPEWGPQSLTDDEIAAWSRMIFLLGDERLHEVKGGAA
jgi:hypothetical protein